MRKHAATVTLLGMLLTGVALLLYPSVSSAWNAGRQSRAIAGYVESVGQLDENRYETLWADAQAYNESLAEGAGGYILTEAQQAEYEALLDVSGLGIMGYLEIPQIDCSLPIYHGTDEAVLQIAVGHLEWSSLPVGGESAHCVLSGHRGLPSAKLFTELDRLQIGDRFFLWVLDKKLRYEVDQILTVEPQELESLAIVPGEDYCTLVTCTPYGINSHRLLVRGHRAEDREEAQTLRAAADTGADIAVPTAATGEKKGRPWR